MSYEGRVTEMEYPRELLSGSPIYINVKRSYIKSDPLGTSVDVFYILKKQGTEEQLDFKMLRTQANGQNLTVSRLTAKFPPSGNANLQLEFWLKDPPSKPGWHRLDTDKFTVNQVSSIMYSGSLGEIRQPTNAKHGERIYITIPKSHILAKPVTTVQASWILYDRVTDKQITFTPATVRADGKLLPEKRITLFMPPKSVKWSLELWLKDPPTRPGWHKLDSEELRIALIAPDEPESVDITVDPTFDEEDEDSEDMGSKRWYPGKLLSMLRRS